MKKIKKSKSVKKSKKIKLKVINKLRRLPAFGDDYFMRFLFGKPGNEKILKDMVNATLRNFGFEEVEDLEVMNPFNLASNKNLKESILDIKAKTKDNRTVIIEIQLCGNMDFIKRIFYYAAKNIVNEVKTGEEYKDISSVISINLLDFKLDFKDEGKPHRCFKLIDTNDHNINLDVIQIHILEVPRFAEVLKDCNEEEIKENKLLSWMKFFTTKDLSSVEKELKEENNIMGKVIEEYKRFTSDEELMNAYDSRDAFLLGQRMMLNRERKEGFEEGVEKGIKQGKSEGLKEGIEKRTISIAKLMKKDGADLNLISKYTGLSIEEIKKL